MNRRDFLKTSLTVTAAVAGTAFLGGSLLNAASVQNSKNGVENGKMKILVITGSPRKNGNSNTLADHFIKGAKEAGHEVVRFDAAFKEVHPCIACNKCGMNGPCVFRDDFEFVRKHIVDAGLVAFATPMYYFGVSAQIKAVIDRFYAINGQIHVPKKAVLMMTYADNSKRKESAIVNHYEVLLDYLGWTDAGQIAPGVWPVGAINRTKYPEQAYRLGKSI
jgi:flavin reductase